MGLRTSDVVPISEARARLPDNILTQVRQCCVNRKLPNKPRV